MLFKKIHLDGIKSGEIRLAFRKWQRCALKAGSLLQTAVGLIKILKIEIVKKDQISDTDALYAGFSDKQQLLKSFPQDSLGQIFKLSICYHSPDPRVALREQTVLSAQQFNTMKKRLKRLDQYSKKGNWTAKVLATIKNHPNLHALGLSELTGFDREWLKLNIRKLKNLGLTISHHIGYEISPLGMVFIENCIEEDTN